MAGSVPLGREPVARFLSGYSSTVAELRGDLAAMSEKHSVPNDSWRAHVDGDDYGFVNEGGFVSFGSLLP